MKCNKARGIFFAALSALLFFVIIARLVQLQFLEHDRFLETKQEISEAQIEVPARRGVLYDRHHTPLAASDLRFQIGVYAPEDWSKPQRSQNLSGLTGIPARRIRQLLHGRDEHVVLSKNAALSPAIQDSFRVLPGLTSEKIEHRNYPLGDVAARVIGRLNHDGRGDAGLEAMFEKRLKGTAGIALVRRDGGLRRTERDRQTVKEPIDGDDLVLTLDKNVLMLVDAELARACERADAEAGMAMAVRIDTGDVLAIAEYPTLHRNRRGGYGALKWQSRPAVASFEPGSTFKVFTIASLLARAVCDTATRFDGEKVEGKRRAQYDFGGFKFQDVHPVGNVSLGHGFAVSSNIIFGKAVGLLRREEFYQDLRSFGFGKRTAMGWPLESAGIIRAADDWSARSQPTIAIGQEVGVTLFQLATAYRAVFGDGVLRPLRLVRHSFDSNGNRQDWDSGDGGHRVLPPKVLPTLRALCADVVNLDYGTGTNARVRGLEVGGKTGTAQMMKHEGPGYDPYRHVAGFVGFAPVEQPRIMVLLFVEGVRGPMKWGGQSAAPAVARIFEGLLLSTEHLDLPAREIVAAETRRTMPDLAGRPADRVYAMAADSELVLSPPAPAEDAVVIGQVPAAGTPLYEGSVRVQLAWSWKP